MESILSVLLVACAPAPGTLAIEAVSHGLIVEAGAGLAGELVCDAPEVTGERHLPGLVGPGAERVVVRGLLAGTRYRCSVGEVIEEAVTPEREAWEPEFVATGSTGGGYTLVNHFRAGIYAEQQSVVIVDERGRVRWSHRLPWEVAGDVDARLLATGTVLYGGGYGGTPEEVDLDGELLHTAPPAFTGGVYHHHVSELGDGTWLALVTREHDDGEGGTWQGFGIQRFDAATGEVLWRFDSQEGLDAGWLPGPEAGGDTDPLHANWVDCDDPPGTCTVSLRDQSALYRFDVERGELLWRLGPGGDFRLLDALGAEADDAAWFYNQHAPEWEGDRVLVYDNGTSRPGGAWSRVVELEVDEVARTARVLWEWTEPGWVEPIWGDADRVGEDRVLITRAHCSTCTLAEASAPSALIDIAPSTGEVLWRLDVTEPSAGFYRAQRIDGCGLFHWAGACPALE